MRDINNVDVLFVGAGPASLAGAIKLKRLLNEKGRSDSVVVIEKAEKVGHHSLSGAVFESYVLDEVVPDWKSRDDAFVTKTLANEVKRDEVVFLGTAKHAVALPHNLLPKALRHDGNHMISVGELTDWLASVATDLGVEIYTGFAAKELVVKGDAVIGVRLGEKGLDTEKNRLANYTPAEVIEAKMTVFGEGSAGLLTEKLTKRFGLAARTNPQIYSLGVKEIIKLPEGNAFGDNRTLHTIGHPLPRDMFGGGALYSMGENRVVVALIMGLDWRYPDFNPHQELQRFKAHPYIRKLIEGGQVVAYGAKTLPEGGYYSIPKLYADGVLVVGDAAGLTSVKKLKGLHYAIKSGVAAGETIFEALENGDCSVTTLKAYQDRLDKSFIVKEIREARNYRQAFADVGLYFGAPLSLIQQWFPFRLRTKKDSETMKKGLLGRGEVGGIDRLTDVSLSGTDHREDEPSHITFLESTEDDRCFKEFGCRACAAFCPGEVYRFENGKLVLSPSNCLHCQTCRIKCPRQIINWELPEGGDGPRYKGM